MRELWYLVFLSGDNTIIVRNEREFYALKHIMGVLGKGKEFDIFGDYSKCKHLFEINGRHEDYMIFEHQMYKGFSFGYTIQSSEDWYGAKPIEMEKLEEEFTNIFVRGEK